jgi:16S rRNA G966 N2-methylase RsmD
MQELHENEQYFFTQETLEELATLLAPFENPCILCAPTLAQHMQCASKSTKPVCVLDIDTRFDKLLPGFRHWNLYKPEHIDQRFDVIFCDPPFFNVSLSQLFAAIRMLANFDYQQSLMICYLTRREQNLLGTFARFHLQPTGIFPTYKTVQSVDRNGIQLYANVGAAM